MKIISIRNLCAILNALQRRVGDEGTITKSLLDKIMNTYGDDYFIDEGDHTKWKLNGVSFSTPDILGEKYKEPKEYLYILKD